MAQMLEAKLVISGDDKTGPAFGAIEKKIAHVSSVAASVSKVAFDVNKMASSVSQFGMNAYNMDRLSHSIGNVSSEVSRAEAGISRMSRGLRGLGEIAKTVGPLVAAAVSAGVMREGEKGIKEGSAIETAKARMQFGAGIKPEEIAEVDRLSVDMMKKYPNVARAEVFDTYKELRSVLSHPEEALPNLDTIVGAKSAMLAGGSGNPEDLVYSMKAAELLGKANDPAEFKKFIDASIKARQVMGKTLRDEDIFELAKMSKTAGMQLSDRFMTTTALSLTQELGGQQAGTALYQAGSTLSGAGLANNHAAVKEWERLGFLKEGDLTYTNKGEIKGLKPGHNLKDWKLGQTDPDRFLYDKLLPAMANAGITDPVEQNKEFQRLFPGSRAANLFAHMNNQREGLENHARMYAEAKGIEGGGDLMKHDPAAALAAAEQSLVNMLGTGFAPLTEKFAPAADSFAKAVGSFAGTVDNFMKEHPTAGPIAVGAGAATTAGVAGYGLYSGLKAAGRAVFGAGEAASEAAASPGLMARIGSGVAAGAGWLGSAAVTAASSPFALAGGMLLASTTPAEGKAGERERQLRYGLPTFASGGVSSPMSLQSSVPTAELKGAADINLKIEVTTDTDAIVRRVEQSMSAFGALRSGTGVSMPEASPGGGTGGQ